MEWHTGEISTHAPTQGATALLVCCTSPTKFQPTPPHRGRRPNAPIPILLQRFQPTPPHRGRLFFKPLFLLRDDFIPLQNFIKILINLFKFLFKSSKTKDQFLSHVLFLCIILSFFLRESPCLSLCTSHSHIFNKLEFQTYQFHSPYLYAQLYFCTVPLKHNIEYYLFLNQLHPIIVFLS